MKGDDAEAITAKTNALAQASMKLGEAMYKQSAEAGRPAAGGGAEPALDGGKKDDVVDAEFTEVDDDKKNKKSLDRRGGASMPLRSVRIAPPDASRGCTFLAVGVSARHDWTSSGGE